LFILHLKRQIDCARFDRRTPGTICAKGEGVEIETTDLAFSEFNCRFRDYQPCNPCGLCGSAVTQHGDR
jgi:hypothetical protein